MPRLERSCFSSIEGVQSPSVDKITHPKLAHMPGKYTATAMALVKTELTRDEVVFSLGVSCRL